MRRFFRWSLTFLLLLATFMECAQVILRHFLQMPSAWLDEGLIFPAIWMYMLGCANASREDTQLAARILPALFPAPRPAAILDFLARFFSLVISLWLTWHALDYFCHSLRAGRATGYLFLPLAAGESAIAAGMILITGYCAAHLVRSMGRLRRALAKGGG